MKYFTMFFGYITWVYDLPVWKLMKDFLMTSQYLSLFKGGRVVIWAPDHWGLGEIDGLLVSLGKAS